METEKLYEYLNRYEVALEGKTIHKQVKELLGIEPLMTQCNNATHSVRILLPRALEKNEKKDLNKLMDKIFAESGERSSVR